mmetsp:Transcript_16246/g.45318  ORF Transcript_16246/g.45318 Transcript_16246/m.45318 type:complete len:375 (+) Transcript_16246:210-1334(+)
MRPRAARGLVLWSSACCTRAASPGSASAGKSGRFMGREWNRSTDEVGQGQQGQQEHPQHDRAPHQANNALQMAELGQDARGGAGRPCGLGFGAGVKGLAAVGRDARRRRAAELQADGASRRCEDDAFVGMQPERGVPAPAVHGLFEVADDGKARRGQPRGQVIDQRECLPRQGQQARVGRRVQGAALEGPIAADKLGHPVEHRAGRPQPDGGAHDEPEEHPEDMAVRRQQRMLDDMTDEFGARQLAGVQMAPFREQLAGRGVIAALHRIPDVGVVVAELAEAQGQIEHQHIECQRQQQAEVAQQPVQQRGHHAGNDDGDGPDDGGMVFVARVEVSARPAHPADDRLVHTVAVPQGLELLTQEGQQHREEIHGPG